MLRCEAEGRLGEHPDDLKKLSVLNKILRITERGLLHEANPRHCELLAKSLDLEQCSKISTPGVKWTTGSTDEPNVDGADGQTSFQMLSQAPLLPLRQRSPDGE